MSWRRRVWRVGAALVVLLAGASSAPAAASVPPGFQETVALSGLTQPSAVRFAPDGRIFVAEKRGIVKVFDDFGDPTPSIYADLRTQVFDGWDRGMLGLALDPGFTTGRPYVYVLYAYDKDPNSPQVPRWNDVCPTPPGFNGDGCVISGRLSRLNAGVETVLIQDWCQQYPSHSVGSLAFGADGALYVSGGDGASFTFPDYGQDGSPLNPCGDPPAGIGGAQTTPLAQGGALRAQDVRTAGDPTGLSGAILRLNPDTGAAMAGNPNIASPDANTRRIVAYGLRNPFRITVRPGTSEVWVGEVGWGTWEEINRVPNPTGEVRNFGWPCYEGTGRQPPYDTLNLSLCETLYALGPGAHAGPHFTYPHNARVVSGETCPTGSSSISSIAFTPPGGSFPPAYDGALFFADYGRDCIWAMRRGANGLPDPNQVETFAPGAENPVEITFGPNGDLYYVDLGGGTIRRIRSTTTNRAPVARATATPSSGAVPLAVAFDGSASSDPDGSALTYAWDLDGDGAFDDSTAVRPSFTYTTDGTYTARLRVTDPGGLSDTFNVPITAGRPPVPVITITSPAVGTTWQVDDTIAFSGSARDFQGGAIPASGLSWDVLLHHCDGVSGSCHTHTLQSFGGVAGGSFAAPDHDYPSYLEIQLTARDAHGLSATASRRLDPQTARLTLASDPPGATLTLGAQTATAPFTREVIRGSTNSVGAEESQTIGSLPYTFTSWSNSGARNHATEVSSDTTLTATFRHSSTQRLAGADALGNEVAVAEPGMAEVYRTVAEQSGTATEVRLLLAAFSAASSVELGIYADVGGVPTTLLGAERLQRPVPGHWNAVSVDVPGIRAGQAYWIGILNPAGGTGTLRWHDHVGASGMPEQQSLSRALGALPGTWDAGGQTWTGGPVSGYIWGVVPPLPSTPGGGSTGQQSAPPPPSGPVGEWGFDEAGGKRARDASGSGNSGRISGAVRTRGRFGGALSFDGRDDWVTVGDDPSLDLTRAMTLEAWVKPSRRGARSVIVKERGPRLSYGLYARPSGHVFTSAERALRGPALPLRRWSHLAMTWDGAVMRVYRDGVQVARHALTGAAPVSDGRLRIGGNAIWPEFFEGVIDEVRVYDRALGAAEIAADRDAAITPGAERPPSRTSRGGKLRETLRAVHRGTRWL